VTMLTLDPMVGRDDGIFVVRPFQGRLNFWTEQCSVPTGLTPALSFEEKGLIWSASFV